MRSFFLGKCCTKCVETTYGSSRPEVFFKKDVLRNFVKFAGTNLCQSLFKLSCRLKPMTLFKKRLTQMFSCGFSEIFKNIFSYRAPPVATSKSDRSYKSSFWSLYVPRMYTNLNMTDKNRKIGLGK